MKRFRFHFLNKKAIRKNKKEDGKLLKVPVPLGLAEFLVAKSIVQKVSVSLLLKHIFVLVGFEKWEGHVFTDSSVDYFFLG
jgi:hypothetical protein